jgi:hypothetical protein
MTIPLGAFITGWILILLGDVILTGVIRGKWQQVKADFINHLADLGFLLMVLGTWAYLAD